MKFSLSQKILFSFSPYFLFRKIGLASSSIKNFQFTTPRKAKDERAAIWWHPEKRSSGKPWMNRINRPSPFSSIYLEMEALKACYGDTSSDSDSESAPSSPTLVHSEGFTPLPPPPVSLLSPPNSLDSQDFLQAGQASRVRSFPHVKGNYALHVYIPICIPSPSKKELAAFLKVVSSQEPSLHAVDVDLPLNILCKNEEKLEQAVLGREFHISLGRTVPIRVHQIDSMVTMLRQRLQTQQRYWIDLSKWEAFVNDDHTRTFLSLEVVQGGLREITKQIEAVNSVYKLHNLPEFYKDARPHISLAWALGDIGHSLKKVVQEVIKRSAVEKSMEKCAFTCKFNRIECKIGSKTYTICKLSD